MILSINAEKAFDKMVALVVKNAPANAGDARLGFNLCVGKTPWRRACGPPQYSCLENPMDRGAWWVIVHRVAQSDMTEATEQAHPQYSFMIRTLSKL